MDRLGELAGVVEVRGLRLHPQDVRVRGGGQGLGDRVADAAANLVVALRRPRALRVPAERQAHLRCGRANRLPRRRRGEGAPLLQRHPRRVTLLDAESERLLGGLADGREPGTLLPDRGEPIEAVIEDLLSGARLGASQLVDRHGEPRSLQPRVCGVRAAGIDRVQPMAHHLRDAGGIETPHHRHMRDPVRRDIRGGDAEDEGLVALVGRAVEQSRSLGIRPGDDDPRHAHDVELEPGSIEALDLLVTRDEHLAGLVPALLGTRLLVLDVVPRNTDFHEPTDQVPNVGITAVAGVGIGDDPGREVDLGSVRALVIGHVQAIETLVAVSGEKGAHDAGGLVGHLGERIAGEVRSGVFGDRALRRGGPPAEVDGLDAGALHRHGLARGVGTERRDPTPSGEERAQTGVEAVGRDARDRVIGRDGAALLGHLARAVKSKDAREPWPAHPGPEGLDLVVNRRFRRDGWPVIDDDHQRELLVLVVAVAEVRAAAFGELGHGQDAGLSWRPRAP